MAALIDWFLGLSYFLIILIISAVSTIITTIIYKYTTNQKKLKENKKEIKRLQAEMKKNKNDQKKMMKIQQEMMSKNMETMKQSFKPMIFTFIPLIILFGWMSATLAYLPIVPGDQYTITATISDAYPDGLDTVTLSSVPEQDIQESESFVAKEGKIQKQWQLKANEAGTYALVVEGTSFKEAAEVEISTGKEYSEPITQYKDSHLKEIVIGNKKVKPFGSFKIFGWEPGWLATYIIISLIISIAFRKALKVV